MSDVDWRELPPVDEAEQPKLPADWNPSQTFLKYHDRCDRAAMLYLLYQAGAGSHELNRGLIFHEVIEALTLLAVVGGEGVVEAWGEDRSHTVPPPEVGKDFLLAYLDEHPHLQVNAVERDALRYMVANWCVGEYFNPEQVIGIELPFTLEIGGFTVQGHVDRADDLGGGMLQVVDYKTSFAMPTDEEFKAQAFTRDGRPYFAGNFQTMLYALGLVFGETELGAIGQDFDRIRLVLRFPRYLRPDGLASREVVVTREQLLDFKLDVEQQLRRLAEVNLGERRWQATPGNHCRECPAEYACPLPKLLRPESQHANLDTLEDLEKAGAAWYFMSTRSARLKARIKKAAERLGEDDPALLDLGEDGIGVRIGTDLALLFVPTETEKIRDKAELREAIEATAQYGESFDWTEHFSHTDGTKFDKRKVTPRR